MDRYRISPTMVVGFSTVDWSEHLCSFCKFIPHEAVRIACGHWFCLECAQQLLTRSSNEVCPCPEVGCGQRLFESGGPIIFTDNFLRSEYKRLNVMCFNNSSGCTWAGKVHELRAHFEVCQYAKVKCRHCPRWIDSAEQKDHFESCRRRYLAGDDFMQRLAALVSSGLEVTSLSISGREEMSEAETRTVQSTSSAGLEIRLRASKEDQQRLQEGQRVVKKVPRNFEESQQDLKVAAISSEVNQDTRESHPSQHHKNTEEDGVMIWGVSQFSRKLEDARSEIRTLIMSPPFYTSYGYKIRFRLYPAWSGSHIALFIVLMKGEYDDTLRWPLPYRVTLKLLNQGSGKDVARTIVPSPLSSSFQKPTAEMNLSAGFPHFIALRGLVTEGLVKDDTLLFQAHLDTLNEQN